MTDHDLPPPPPFPFAALLGQPDLRLALLLAAVDPALGGVLIEGPRGSAKSTAARALAELLADAPFVTLPLGASLEHLVGSLDLGAALGGHALQWRPGLLARADGGVLYVDEVNLLPDPLVDALLDAAASGINTVERDGFSRRHRARFALIGTMNPDEGNLRPQLLDRFGLSVLLRPISDPIERQVIVRQRLAFDADPERFRARHAPEQAALGAALARARTRLASLPLEEADAVHARVTERCLAAGVEGLRADLAMLRAARALAAFEGDEGPSLAQVDRVASLVLRHRATTASEPARADAPAASSARGDDSPAGGTGTADDATDKPRGDDGGEGSGGSDGDEGGQDDWGALPPEPTGIRAVQLAALPPDRAPARAKKR